MFWLWFFFALLSMVYFILLYQNGRTIMSWSIKRVIHCEFDFRRGKHFWSKYVRWKILSGCKELKNSEFTNSLFSFQTFVELPQRENLVVSRSIIFKTWTLFELVEVEILIKWSAINFFSYRNFWAYKGIFKTVHPI